MSARAPQRTPRGAAPAAALLGFFSVAAQTVLARELLVLFHGSELALGVVLAAWLLLGGCGSLAAARALAGRTPPPHAAALAAAAAALSLPLAVLAVRFSAAWLPLPPGVVPGVRLGAAASVAVLALPAAAGGAWFALAAAAWRDAAGPGRAYAWEAAGGLAGGVLFSFVLAGTADALVLSGLLAFATALAAAAIAARTSARPARLLAAGCVATALAIAFAGPLVSLAGRSQAARWPGLGLVAAHDGRHGSLALVRAAGQSTLFENGSPAFSFPDDESAEAATHLPLLAAPGVDAVLLTGGALGGGLGEALKHPVRRVDLLVPNREVLRFVRPHLPPALTAALADPRVAVREGDLRGWLAAHRGAYDVVLAGHLEPSSALENRLATREFFALVRGALREGGVAALSLSAAPNYRGRELLARNASVYRALAAAFPRVEALRDDPLTLVASASPAPLVEPGLLAARLVERRIAARTLSPEVVAALLAPERAALALDELRAAAAQENRDLAPAAYLHHARHREAAADPVAAGWLAALSGRARWLPFALPALLATLALLALLSPRGDAARRRPAAGIAAATTGATAMALQFLLFFAYQTARGDLYAGLGVLSGLFMAGLAAGGALALRLHRRNAVRPLLVGAGIALVALPALAGAALPAVLAAGSGGHPHLADLLAGLVAVAGGCTAGFAFPLLGLANAAPTTATGGALYAWDLAGSAAGALLASLWLLPFLGFPATLGFLALLAGTGWVFVAGQH